MLYADTDCCVGNSDGDGLNGFSPSSLSPRQLDCFACFQKLSTQETPRLHHGQGPGRIHIDFGLSVVEEDPKSTGVKEHPVLRTLVYTDQAL